MSVRAIDTNRDWMFGQGRQSYKVGEAELGQMINTRVLSFLGDCFFATDEGIDWWNLLGRGNQKEQLLKQSIGLTILNTEGVTAINNVDIMRRGRDVVIYYDVQTIYSQSYQQQIEVNNG